MMQRKHFVTVILLYTITTVLFMKSTVNNKKYQLTTSTGKRDEETQKEINVKIRKLQKVINAMLLYNQSFKQEDRNFSRNFRHGGCRHYASDAKRKRFAVTSLWKDYLDVKYYDVTMIMQLTVDRIKLLNLHVENWSGPMSVTLYVKVDELRELEESLTTTTSVLHRDNVDIHLVVKTGRFHPGNYLRNIAVNQSLTKYVFYNDADFIINRGAYEKLQTHIEHGVLNEKKVLVIPAFEFRSVTDFFLPENKTVVKQLLAQGKLIPFHKKRYLSGHGQTDTTRWRNTNSTYHIQWKVGYEPYIVGEKNKIPFYNESFIGRGKNKVVHLMFVHIEGFGFTVLPDVYLIHHPHDHHMDIYDWLSDACSIELYTKMYIELIRKYPQQFPFVHVMGNGKKVYKSLYIFREGGKRLGNQLYWFATTYGIARYHHRKNLWGNKMKTHLMDLFPGIEQYMNFSGPVNWPELPTRHVNYDPSVTTNLPDANLTLQWFTHSYRYFNHCNSELYYMMQLNSTLVKRAEEFINKSKLAYVQELSTLHEDDISVVGVHVRRGDKLHALYQDTQHGYRIPDPSHILYAMDYLRYKHNHKVIFVISSDDKKWCNANLVKQSDTFLTPFSSPYQDFTTLASCDHLIMTQSSFAWWAAWLLEQRVIHQSDHNKLHQSNYTKLPDILFYKYPFWNNTRFGRNYVRSNTYPEHWKAYTNHSIDTQHQVLCDTADIKSCFTY